MIGTVLYYKKMLLILVRKKLMKKKFEDVFDGDGNALSEDGNSLGVNTTEIEVFQIVF